MPLSFYIARRYLFAPKKHRAVNVISALSACGVALATLALVCTLSVFNGFQEMVAGFFTAFDPELKITVREGKTFCPSDSCLQAVRRLPEVDVWSETLEDNALVKYKDRQTVAVVKGVDGCYEQLASIDSLLFGAGEFILQDSVADYVVPGVELMSSLGCGIGFIQPLEVYVPRQGMRINPANPALGLRKGYLHSSGLIFIVNQQKYDAHYLLTSLDFARRLFGQEGQVSAIELRLVPGADVRSVQRRIAGLIGPRFRVENRYEQQADVFRIMEIEKLISYLFLTFILVVACFNLVGSLSMLILEKRDNVQTLRNLGADERLVRRIFLYEGGLIAVFGALAGIAGGLLLCWAQQQFGFLSLGSSGEFVTDAYPVSIHPADVLLVFVTVVAVSWLSVWWPVRYLSRKLL
ncbi:MAG TPA: FtsX-like permease family protein [Candidatus Bacteroides avicola]|uniref:FtsX-like permease family protein n=1 Tax=Candidatus Bacteroides avicola TaxID=2838468 RepID=A0A9D2HSY6_9BACE|nr:FtsX-like permease family protein [Mediterranea sp. An20]OUP12200.1 hypothetical protein B5F34_00905 [Mediterranea sp. An20]HJA84714.1 FtsX-like permease family protein [Candidatus Bacteroides avicola]